MVNTSYKSNARGEDKMNFLDLTTSGKNVVDRWVIDDIKKESEYILIKKVAGMVSIPVNNYNYRRGTNIKLSDWSDDSFGYFATYAFFLYGFESTLNKTNDINKTVSFLMETLMSNLIEEHQGLELEKILALMRQNIGISKRFHNSLVDYFIEQKNSIAALQSEFPHIRDGDSGNV